MKMWWMWFETLSRLPQHLWGLCVKYQEIGPAADYTTTII